MAAVNFRGVTVPTAGDGLLTGFEEAFASAGVITTAASVAAARLTLTEADAAGVTVSPTRPMYFNISGIIYVATGAKTDGVWTMKPVNETEFAIDRVASGQEIQLANGVHHELMTSSLPAAPYDRIARAEADVYSSFTEGVIHLAVRIQGGPMALSRLDTAANVGAHVSQMGVIPAGQAPAVTLSIYGGAPSGGKTTVISDQTLNRLIVTAEPVTMAG